MKMNGIHEEYECRGGGRVVCVKPCVCVCCVVWKIEFISCNVLLVVVMYRKHGKIHGKYGCCSMAECSSMCRSEELILFSSLVAIVMYRNE